MVEKLRWTVFFTILLGATGSQAHDFHVCPADFPDEPAMSGHIAQVDIVDGLYNIEELFELGRELFVAQFNICDGQGRPAATGTGDARVPDEPTFVRTSAPDSNSCAGCHNMPRAGGAGDFVANVFVLAQALDPVTESVSADLSNDRNTLGMFGAGAIEMLAREMTVHLQAQAAALGDGTHVLHSKGVDFEVEISGGTVVASKGVDRDLIVKPFHQAGVVASLREFTVNAMNQHHGMQAEERFDLNPDKGFKSDFDLDGVDRELTVGDITAVTLFQAALGVPGRVLPASLSKRKRIARGEMIFSEVGCASCHIPEMTLENRMFVEPSPFNPPGTFSDTSQSYAFDLTRDGEKPRLERAGDDRAIVRAYTDLKRHDLCDDETSTNDPIRFFCNEQLAQGRQDEGDKPGTEFFLTRKLWDVGNSGPYGHRGDLTTLAEAILMHGGEARESRDSFVARPIEDQRAVVDFLKSLQVLPAGSARVVVDCCGGNARRDDPPAGSGVSHRAPTSVRRPAQGTDSSAHAAERLARPGMGPNVANGSF